MTGALTMITDPAVAIFSRLTSSPQAKAATAATITTVAVLTILVGLSRSEKKSRVRSLKNSIPLRTDSGNVRHPIESQLPHQAPASFLMPSIE